MVRDLLGSSGGGGSEEGGRSGGRANGAAQDRRCRRSDIWKTNISQPQLLTIIEGRFLAHCICDTIHTTSFSIVLDKQAWSRKALAPIPCRKTPNLHETFSRTFIGASAAASDAATAAEHAASAVKADAGKAVDAVKEFFTPEKTSPVSPQPEEEEEEEEGPPVSIAGKLGGGLRIVADKSGEVAGAAKSGAVKVGDSVSDAAKGAAEGAKDATTGAVKSTKEAAQEAAETVKEVRHSFYRSPATVDWLPRHPFQSLNFTPSQVSSTAAEKSSSAVEAVKAQAEQVKSDVTAALEDAAAKAKETAETAKQETEKALEGAKVRKHRGVILPQ